MKLKNILCTLLAVMMVFSFAACGSSEADANKTHAAELGLGKPLDTSKTIGLDDIGSFSDLGNYLDKYKSIKQELSYICCKDDKTVFTVTLTYTASGASTQMPKRQSCKHFLNEESMEFFEFDQNEMTFDHQTENEDGTVEVCYVWGNKPDGKYMELIYLVEKESSFIISQTNVYYIDGEASHKAVSKLIYKK